MARIRTIKPEFFTSADIVSLTPLARLFYVSLWCEADREGRLSWNPKTLKIRYFPVDDCSIFDLAQELIGLNLIEIYEIDGKEYAEIPSFKNHQVINNRESDSVLPARDFHASPRVTGEGRKEGKEGRERKGREYTSLPCDLKPSQTNIDFCSSNGLDAQEQFQAFCSNAKAKALKYADWNAAFRLWIGNSVKWAAEKSSKQSDQAAWWGKDCS